MIERLKAVWKDDEGATAVEYGLMVALIAAIIITTVAALGGKVKATFVNVDAGNAPVVRQRRADLAVRPAR